MTPVNVAELARLTGQSTKHIRTLLARAGLDSEPGPHRARLYPSDRALSILLCGCDRLDPGQEKARLDMVRRQRVEIDLAKARGEVVDVRAAWDYWAGHLSVTRQHLLALPNAIAVECAGPADRAEVQALAQRVVRRVLTELSEAPVLPPGSAQPQETSHDRKPVEELQRPDRSPRRGGRRAQAADDEGGAAPGRGRARATRPAPAADR